MRKVEEVQSLFDGLRTLFKWIVMVHGTKIPENTRYGYLTEVQTLVAHLLNRYEVALKKSSLAVAEFGSELEDLMGMANRTGIFLSRAGDQDGAHFCFAVKNVYQFVLEEPDSPWDRFPTRREDLARGH